MSDGHQRAHTRVEANISVSMRLPDGRAHSTGKISNISLGGVFVEIDEPLSFGSEIDLEFRVPTHPEIVRCKGIVMWNTKTQPQASARPGMGLRLMQIGVGDMRRLASFVDSQMLTPKATSVDKK